MVLQRGMSISWGAYYNLQTFNAMFHATNMIIAVPVIRYSNANNILNSSIIFIMQKRQYKKTSKNNPQNVENITPQ